MSGIVTVRAATPEAQRALLTLADASTEVLDIGSRIGGRVLRFFFKSCRQAMRPSTLFFIIVERFPDKKVKGTAKGDVAKGVLLLEDAKLTTVAARHAETLPLGSP